MERKTVLIILGVVVVLLTFPLLPTLISRLNPPGDSEKMAEIRKAINAYGNDIGYYPPSLYALVPDYLAEVPTNADLLDFIYNPQDGALTNPSEVSKPRKAKRKDAPPVGSTGPMGEVMTGISIQEELNY